MRDDPARRRWQPEAQARSARQSRAVSVAGVLLLSEATMTEPPEPPEHNQEAIEP